MLPTYLLVSLLLVIPAATTTQVPLVYQPSPLTFHLRHLHVANSSHILFSDVPQGESLESQDGVDNTQAPYTLMTRMMKTHRPSSFASHAQARVKPFSWGEGKVEELTWGEEDVVGPDVTNRMALLHLAKMTNNAYANDGNGREWYDLGRNWNISFPFGWEEDADGFRGHVFTTPDNSTVIISIKGTSTGILGGGGPTARKDKLNDNLLFSCCCARVDITWSPVCGCYAGGWKCDNDCLESSLVEDSLFYPIGTTLYNNVSYMYPDSTIWLIGHSLGGALASLLGVTFGAPVVAFEAPGEKMASERLHLPAPPTTQHITHVYHTADPIPMGTCNGLLSACAIAGYALESRCHLGNSIVYDTVTKWNWSVDVRRHPIKVIIEELLGVDWNKAQPKEDGNVVVTHGTTVPGGKPELDCVECYSWEYGKFLDPGNW